MVKKGWIFLILLLGLVFPVMADEPEGSIVLTMRYQDAYICGGTVTLYDITELPSDKDPDQLAAIVHTGGIKGISREIGSDGAVSFQNLSIGHYLLVQEQVPAGFEPMRSFCVSIPMRVGDQMLYHIEAAPKLERIPETQLPQTGQRNMPVWGLLIGGLLLSALGLLLQKQK